MSDPMEDEKQPTRGRQSGRKEGNPTPRKISFDDFQIEKNAQQHQLDQERRAMKEREERLGDQKPGFLKFAVPRLRSIGEDMIGGGKKLSSLIFGKGEEGEEDIGEFGSDTSLKAAPPAYAEEEHLKIRTVHGSRGTNRSSSPRSSATPLFEDEISVPSSRSPENFVGDNFESEEALQPTASSEPDTDFIPTDELEEPIIEFESEHVPDSDETSEDESIEEETDDRAVAMEFEAEILQEEDLSQIYPEPQIDRGLDPYLEALRGFDSTPKRAFETRDPRADFVLLLSEQLDILREQVGAMSTLFFWVNTRKQQLVLECGSLEDHAHMLFSREKKFPIELDAVSMVVSRKKPELHSTISPQTEVDLIPYYTEAAGVASFAAMPVLFGEGLVAVITVDSDIPEHFSHETLRILTSHSKLISGLIKSYIEKYDLLASARTLEAARSLYQLISPDVQTRVKRDSRKGAEWVLRALTEAISEIVDWEWLAAVSFDDTRRFWAISSLQSRNTGKYIQPQSQVELAESVVGKCIQSGRHVRFDSLPPHEIRFNLEEDRKSATGHSFLTIPIRTASKNYGALAIEHSERGRYTETDVETLEHLARSAAAALEITALSEIVDERALTDLLTGSLNKRGFLQRITEELSRAMEFDESLTLVLFEIDGASEFFSRFAQEEADTVVLAVTRLLRYGSRTFDVIARVGEHAFAAILVKMTDEEGYLWSEKMRKTIVSEVIALGKRSFSVTASAGVSGARRDTTVEELIEGAELAVERAKELGGNTVIVY